MKITFAQEEDAEYLIIHDTHISTEVIAQKIARKEIIICQKKHPIGWLRFGLLWDEIPFMNLLMIEKGHRNQGYGTKLVKFWEDKMKEQGYSQVMTSTLSNEDAQHFYRKLGYKDCGSLIMPGEPLEILMRKRFK
ncbi:MAG TPA: GNAT family N-acetyltransferase [Longilinea sp.]|nr:GNAT family N-acetyltransferase [Longilinea sp.]